MRNLGWLVLAVLVMAIGASSGLSLALAEEGSRADDPIRHRRTDTPTKRNAHSGRYLYLGNVPSGFQAHELELYVSKVALTLRVKAWVSQDLIRNYGRTLFERWQRIHNAFQDPSMSLEPLVSAEQLMEEASRSADPVADQAWVAVISKYMDHVLRPHFSDLHNQELSPEAYRDGIVQGLWNSYFHGTLSIFNPLSALETVTLGDYLLWSEVLFRHHLGASFTPDNSKGSDYEGFLTFVYPIAATAQGPFDQPSESFYYFGQMGAMLNARWWSGIWQDEFGGFPFLAINPSGVAFHGPVSTHNSFDVWFLRREFISHGCFRMDASDLLELRALLPRNFKSLPRSQSVSLWVTQGPDVTDIDGDGRVEAIDVEYYQSGNTYRLAEGETPEQIGEKWNLENQQRDFWRAKFSGVDRSRHLGGENRFDSDAAVFTQLPRYSLERGSLQRVGKWHEVPVRVVPRRKGRIIQYRESGATLRREGEGWHDDNEGKYPPIYFR